MLALEGGGTGDEEWLIYCCFYIWESGEEYSDPPADFWISARKPDLSSWLYSSNIWFASSMCFSWSDCFFLCTSSWIKILTYVFVNWLWWCLFYSAVSLFANHHLFFALILLNWIHLRFCRGLCSRTIASQETLQHLHKQGFVLLGSIWCEACSSRELILVHCPLLSEVDLGEVNLGCVV